MHETACAGSRQRQGAAGDGGAESHAAAGAESAAVEVLASGGGGVLRGADTTSSSSSSQSALSSASERVGYATLSGFSARQPGGDGTATLRRPTATSIGPAAPQRKAHGGKKPSCVRRVEAEAGKAQAGPA